jgi:hypothetical protein
MSDHDRGPYTPPSDRLSFDPREPVRGGGPAPVTLIVSGVLLLGVIGGVFLVYRGGVRHRSGDAPAAVGASVGEIKTPAAPDANAAAPRLVIDRSDVTNAAASAAPNFAPAAEQPLPRPLPMQPAPVEVAPLPPPAATPAAGEPPAPPVVTPPRPAVTTASQTPPAAPSAPAKPGKPLTIASLTDAALATKPAKPAPRPAAAASPAAVSATGATPPAGAGWVQIGAYSSPALAQKGWSDVARLEPAAMAGKGRRLEALERDGKTLYRTYITGFSHDGAESFCGELKAAGKACFVK